MGFALVRHAGSALLGSPAMQIVIASVLLVGAGLLLTLGLCTPIAGTLVALVEIGRLVTVSASKLTYLLLAPLAASLAMLGPGQWSVDARLFGWKRMEASPPKRRPWTRKSPAVPYKKPVPSLVNGVHFAPKTVVISPRNGIPSNGQEVRECVVRTDT